VSGVPRHLVVAAFESLAAGDHHEALSILTGALEDDGPPALRCPVCGQAAWPGDDARHIWSRHRAAVEIAA
jgi:hypothetical protein